MPSSTNDTTPIYTVSLIIVSIVFSSLLLYIDNARCSECKTCVVNSVFLIFCNLCNDITPLCTYTLHCIPLPSCVSLQLGVLHIQVMRLYEVQTYNVVRFPGMQVQLGLISLGTLKGNAVCPEHCIVDHL